MRNAVLIGAMTATFFGEPAIAADLTTKMHVAPISPMVVSNWTGFYIGLHAGWGWTTNNDASAEHVFPPAPGTFGMAVPFDLSSNGAVVGGQIAYTWQFASNWVLGIEGDWSGAHLNGAATGNVSLAGAPDQSFGNANMSQDVNWMATLRARLGYVWGQGMLYVTGGGAWANVSYSGAYNSIFLAGLGGAVNLVATNTKSGWTIGGGYEHKLAGNWVARAEYLYYDLGGFTASLPTVFAPTFPIVYTADDLKLSVVRMGLSYKF